MIEHYDGPDRRQRLRDPGVRQPVAAMRERSEAQLQMVSEIRARLTRWQFGDEAGLPMAVRTMRELCESVGAANKARANDKAVTPPIG